MEAYGIVNDLIMLFSLSFLAATIMPLGSEWLLVLLVLKGISPSLLVPVATLGNTMGAFTTYGIGLWGSHWMIRKFQGTGVNRLRSAEKLFQRYGSWSLLLSWVPVVGDSLCLAGGLMKVNPWRFLLLVTTGKLARYLVVANMTLQPFF